MYSIDQGGQPITAGDLITVRYCLPPAAGNRIEPCQVPVTSCASNAPASARIESSSFFIGNSPVLVSLRCCGEKSSRGDAHFLRYRAARRVSASFVRIQCGDAREFGRYPALPDMVRIGVWMSRMPSRLRFVFWLDATLLISVCALETVPFTGMIVHEWLGLALAGMIVAHLLLSWTWIATSTRRFVTAASSRTRVNYVLNWCLFSCVTAVIYSGILISRQAIPALTMKEPDDIEATFRWDRIHDRFSNFVVIFAALHLAINWDWSVAAARKIVERRTRGKR